MEAAHQTCPCSQALRGDAAVTLVWTRRGYAFTDSATNNETYNMKSSQLKTGDILINITGASIGRTCLFSLENGSANINQHIAFLRTKFWINEFYVSLFLKCYFIKTYIEIEQNGASKEAFNLSQIANIPLALPSQAEQRSIAYYLDTKTAQIDRKVDILTQKATQYGNLKQSLINEAVTRGLDRSVVMKDSDYEWDQQIPDTWQEKRVKNIFKLVTDLAQGYFILDSRWGWV